MRTGPDWFCPNCAAHIRSGAKCCNPACGGEWGTGCHHCHHPRYYPEAGRLPVTITQPVETPLGPLRHTNDCGTKFRGCSPKCPQRIHDAGRQEGYLDGHKDGTRDGYDRLRDEMQAIEDSL